MRKYFVATEALCSGQLPVDFGCNFVCENQLGAALVTKQSVYRETYHDNEEVRRYIARHIDSWYAFAKRLDEIEPKDGFLLVRGCDKTAEWALAAFAQKHREARISFTGGFVSAGGQLSLSGSWSAAMSAEYRSGPDRGAWSRSH